MRIHWDVGCVKRFEISWTVPSDYYVSTTNPITRDLPHRVDFLFIQFMLPGERMAPRNATINMIDAS